MHERHEPPRIGQAAGRMRRRKLLPAALCAAGLLALTPVFAANADHDPRKPAALEIATFLPLICDHPQKLATSRPAGSIWGYQYRCAKIIGYPSDPGDQAKLALSPRNRELALSAIAYGSFTRAGADEAYLSYNGSMESHATLFGGGILFARQNRIWRVVQWYPAERRQDCVALPSAGRQEMLCLESDGHADSSFEDLYTTLSAPEYSPLDQEKMRQAEMTTMYRLSRDIAAFRSNNFPDCDERKENPAHFPLDDTPCARAAKGSGALIKIDGLRRSTRPGDFAEASVEYATPQSMAQACRKTCYLDVQSRQGRIEFRLNGTKIVVVMPDGLDLEPEFQPDR